MKKLKLAIVLLALTTSLTACNNSDTLKETAQDNGQNVTEEASNIEETTSQLAKDVEPEEFKNLLESKGGLLLDVRTPEEVAEGTIEGSKNIDFYKPTFKEEISKLDKNSPVFVFCRSGGRSGKTMNMMKDLGFKEVYNLKGGYSAWPYK